MDFALILVCLSALTGVVWLVDALFFAKRRRSVEGEPRKEPLIVEYSRSFFPVIFIVLLIRSFLAEPFRIPSSSMLPTLLIGDFILVNKFAYGLKLPVLDYEFIDFGEPERGDVVVFRYPKDPRQDYIKRVVGLPGDTVSYRNKTVFVNQQAQRSVAQERYVGVCDESRSPVAFERRIEKLGGVEHEILQDPRIFPGGRGEVEVVVPQNSYFVMGDNRDCSADSRYWGFVPERNLVGPAFFIWMNWDSGIDFGRPGTVIH